MSNAMFLKVEGVDGESTDDAHEKWIEILSYSHGLSQPATGVSGTGGQTGGRADFQDLVVTKVLDSSTPDLNIKCAKGEHIPKVELEKGGYSIAENAGSVLIDIERKPGSPPDAFSVELAVMEGSATEPEDFVAPAVIPVAFGVAEDTITVAIPIVDDGEDEGGELFSVKLQNPVGADLFIPDLGRGPKRELARLQLRPELG